MKVDVLPIGQDQENSYVLHDRNHVLFIDPGRRAKQIAACVGAKETVDGIILTHGHADHTQAADDLADFYDCDVYMSHQDLILTDPEGVHNYGFDGPVYHEILNLKDHMRIGSFTIDVIATPGHTAGSVCVRCGTLLFTGDTLFAGDIGRTDLFGGSETDLAASLKKLAQLPHDLKVLPGHGPASTIGNELMCNPYFVYAG